MIIVHSVRHEPWPFCLSKKKGGKFNFEDHKIVSTPMRLKLGCLELVQGQLAQNFDHSAGQVRSHSRVETSF